MGNCQQQFENIQLDHSEIEEQDRIQNTAISQVHHSIQVARNQQEKVALAPPMDQQMVHSTYVKKNSYILNLQEPSVTEEEVHEQSYPKLEELTFDFYHSLGLDDYNYKMFPRQEYVNIVTLEHVDSYGVKYVGEWKEVRNERQLHGNGVLVSNTSKYIGQFKNGLKHYHGREIFKNQVYQGCFEASRRKGEGVRYTHETTQNGIFDGNLVQGEIMYSNGNHFKGNLKKNKYQGTNIMFFDAQNNIRYEKATYVGGNMTYAMVQYSNGNVYQGQISKHCKHGKGKYTWADGSTYEGQYCWDEKHGKGILHNKGSAPVQCQFNHGKLEGQMSNDDYELKSQLPSEWRE